MTIQTEFDYFLSHKEELVRNYNGKVVVIFGGAVIGVYGSDAEAVSATKKTHALGSFLVQKIEPGDQAYKQTFHSRVSFASF